MEEIELLDGAAADLDMEKYIRENYLQYSLDQHLQTLV